MVRISLAVVILSVVATGCKKAKMRTVPRQAPVAASSASATAPQASLQGERDEPIVEQPIRPPMEPAPTKPEPIVEDRPAGPSAPLPPPRPRTDEGPVATPAPAPKRSPKPAVIIEKPAPAPRVQAEPRPRPEPKVTVRKAPPKKVVKVQQFELVSTDILHCRWEPTASPMTYMKYDPKTKTAWVQSGFPQQWAQYSRVKIVSGRPPYGDLGLTLVTTKGFAIAHVLPSENGRLPTERTTSFSYEATFGDIPGGPLGEPQLGVCWTASEPGRESEQGNHSAP